MSAIPIFSRFTETGWAEWQAIAEDAEGDWTDIDRVQREHLADNPMPVLVFTPTAVRSMASWCRSEGVRNDAAGRTRFVVALLEHFDVVEGSA